MQGSKEKICMACFEAPATLQCRHCNDFFICSRACAEDRDVPQELHKQGACIGSRSDAEKVGDDYGYMIEQWREKRDNATTDAEWNRADWYMKYWEQREEKTGGKYGHWRPEDWDPHYRYGLTSEELIEKEGANFMHTGDDSSRGQAWWAGPDEGWVYQNDLYLAWKEITPDGKILISWYRKPYYRGATPVDYETH